VLVFIILKTPGSVVEKKEAVSKYDDSGKQLAHTVVKLAVRKAPARGVVGDR
jgi:hypothetical protein